MSKDIKCFRNEIRHSPEKWLIESNGEYFDRIISFTSFKNKRRMKPKKLDYSSEHLIILRITLPADINYLGN